MPPKADRAFRELGETPRKFYVEADDGWPALDVRLGPHVVDVDAVEQHQSQRHDDEESNESECSSQHV